MPVVSAFFGILIRMFYREHGPPHFHAEHRGEKATFSFEGELIAGAIKSPTARRQIQRWATLHGAELVANWRRLQAGEPLERIEPLP